ncbi:hypothetical protein [Levilactobacillus parabrevis]|uniref:hypothetical protein n=1 Tax=Levilactobacillus parabrevis TaxID=357278 RepID=UPI0037578FF1
MPVYSTGNLEDTGASWLQIESEARFSGWSVPTASGIPGSRRRQFFTRQRRAREEKTVARDFTDLMNQLKDKKIEQFEVTPEDFPAFQKAFMAYETRKRVVGKAEKNGKLIYHYDYDAGNDGE